MKKNNQKDILLLREKENLRNFISYLVDSYYLNPKNKLSINEIKKQLKIKECKVLNEFIFYLEKKEYIKINKKKLTITYDGFYYLESLQKSNKEYENNLINIVVSITAFIISLFAFIWSNSIISKILLTTVLFIFVLKIFKFINDILNKKYY